MRASDARPAARLAAEFVKNRSRMSSSVYVGRVRDVEPAPRRPHDFRRSKRRCRAGEHQPAYQPGVADGEQLRRHTARRPAQHAVTPKPFTLEDKADLMRASTWAVRSAARATDLMHRMGGTNGIYARSRLERHFRDTQTVRHHGFVSDSRMETVGQVYLGAPPEFPFVAF